MSTDSLVRSGRTAEAKYDRSTALEHYRKAVEEDPDHREASFRLAYNLELVGEEEESLSLFQRVCAGEKAPLNALVNLAVLYEDAGDYNRAQRCLKLVLDTDPNHARARLYMKDVQASRWMEVVEGQQSDPAMNSALIATPVADFELSSRARNCLRKMNVRTLGDLLRVSESELMAYKNLGDNTVHEIKNLLTSRGLRLGQNLEAHHSEAIAEIYQELATAGGQEATGVLDQPVEDLDLSVRAKKALSLLSIKSIGELVARTEAELMGIKNFGATSLDEIKAKLQERGLGLRPLEGK